jgi:two-component system C4-dicarboxylate transport sensor histidine kinase DctB
VAAAIRLAHPKTRHQCRVESRVDEPLWVRGNPTHVSQIVVNLLTNASQALAGLRPEVARVFVSAAARDRTVEIIVEDNGPGVAPENVPRLFSPFFTTKGPDEGTGLGLAVSARFVLELPAANANGEG